MIIRQGIHRCDYCGKEYKWTARRREPGEKIVIGNIDDIRCYNVQYFDFYGDRLIAMGHCPYCGMMQRTPLVDEEIDRISM